MTANGDHISLCNGTQLRLADGSAAAVETLTNGDTLLGPDGRSRPVLDVSRRRGALTTTRLRRVGSELMPLVSAGPVPLRKQSLQYGRTDMVISHDTNALRARVEGLVGPLPPPDLKPRRRKQRTKTFPCASFMEALRRGFSTLLAVKRSGAAKARFERAIDGLTGVKFCHNAVFVYLPSSNIEYKTFTWDSAFGGGHPAHPPTAYATEGEARAAAQAWAQSQYQPGTDTLFNLAARFQLARRNGKMNVRVSEGFQNFRIFWDPYSLKRNEFFVHVYDQQVRPGWSYKYAFTGIPDSLDVGAAAAAAPATVLRVFDAADLADVCRHSRTDGGNDGVSLWHLEHLVTGINFVNENAPPVHPLVVGYLVGAAEAKDVKEGDFLNWLHRRLAALVDAGDAHDLYALDLDPLQDCHVDVNGEHRPYRYLRKQSDMLNEKQEFGQAMDVSEQVEEARLSLWEVEMEVIGQEAPIEEPAVSLNEVLVKYDLDETMLYRQLTDINVLGSSAESHLPPQYLTASRQHRLELLAGLAEACHATIASDRMQPSPRTWVE